MREDITQIITRSIKKRESFFKYTNAVRLVNGIGDGLNGFVLEQYNRHFVVQVFEKMWLDELPALKRFFSDVYAADYVIIKDRTDSASSNPDAFRTQVLIEKTPSTTTVQENGLKFSVDLNDGLNSGLFLDMRHNRSRVASFAKDKKVLNCFAYTCSFGVHCKAAGALSVSNVDVSQKCLQKGRQNYELNALSVGEYEFVRADVGYYLDRAVAKANCFDMIILDPPSFSRHDNKVFSVKKDLLGLMTLAIKALNPGGQLFVATNCSGISPTHLEAMLQGSSLRVLERLTQDKDFVGSGRNAESYLAALLCGI